MRLKGFTVHLSTGEGKTACGATPRLFLGKPAITKDVRRVTCRECERRAQEKTTMNTYQFNLTFTRPNEDDEHVYVVGVNRTASNREEAERLVREDFDHLTILHIDLFEELQQPAEEEVR